MSRTGWPGRGCASLIFLSVSAILAAEASPAAAQASAPFQRWAAAHAVPIVTVGSDSGTADLQKLRSLIGTARVVALGEPAHGAHEPLAFRNRLFRYLVEDLGFTAIALESGLPESRRVVDFVAGRPGAPAAVTREGLTWGFGNFQENEHLIQWIRTYNANPGHHRKIKFYGIDLSLGGPAADTPTPAALETVLDYLARADSGAARDARAGLQPFLARLPGDPAWTQAEHDSFTDAIKGLTLLLERKRPALIAATDSLAFEWAYRNAIVARQEDRLFRVSPRPVPGGGIPPDAWRAASARDRAMAENVLWALAQEGPRGRLLVFAHNAHVKGVPTTGGIWDALDRPPSAMGQYLRAALGNRLVTIGTSAAYDGPGLPQTGLDPTSVDAALARVGPRRFLLDLRPSAADSASAAWLAVRRPLRTNFTTFLTLSPQPAFDALFFIDSLTPAHSLPASP